MKKRRYRWWRYVRRMIRDYPQISNAATLTPDDIKDRDAVAKAIDLTRKLPKGEECLALISLIYWGAKERRVKEAALLCYISEATAKRWHGEFVRLVGQCWGFDVKT